MGGRWQLHGYCPYLRSQNEAGWRNQLHGGFYRKRTAEESTRDFVFGRPLDSSDRSVLHHQLYWHQSGQCSCNHGGWTASSGTLSANGATAALNTAGVYAGPITVSAVATDSRGLKSAPATTQVMVENPPPHRRRRPATDAVRFPEPGEALARRQYVQGGSDDVAKNLQQNADSKLVIVW